MRRFRWLLHLAVAAVVLGLVLRNLGWRDVLGHFGDMRLGVLLIAAALVLVDGQVRVWNWQQLLRGLGLRAPRMYSRLTSCYLSGSFLGTVVPSTAGTDALRAMFASSLIGGHLALHTAPLVTLNILGLSAGCAIGLVGLSLIAGNGYSPAFLTLAGGVFIAAFAAAMLGFLVLKYQRGLLVAILRTFRKRWFWLRRIGRKFLTGLAVFSRPNVSFLQVFGVTLISQLLRAGVLMLVAGAVGLHLPVGVWLMMAPLTTLSGLLPLSVAGFGGEQAVLVYLLAPFGVDSAQAVAISLTFATLYLVTNMVYGGIAFLLSSRLLRLPDAAGAPH